MTLPTSLIEVEKRGLGNTDTANSNVHALIGCATAGPFLTPRRVQRRALQSTFQAGIGVSAGLISTDGSDAPIVFVRVPSTARAASRTLDLDAFTGDAAVALGVGNATTGADVRILFTTPATIGITGGMYRVSVDGGKTYGTETALGVATSITVLGVPVNLESGKEVAGTIGLLLIPASESIYGVDTLGVSGTSVATLSGTPIDQYDGIAEIVVGGNPGVDGMRLRYSLDGGIRFSPTKRLGTALTYAFEDSDGIPSGVSIAFTEIYEAAFITLVAELRTDFLAHIALTAGGVHGVADATAYGIGSAPTTKAQAIAVLNQIFAALVLHAGLVYPLVPLATALRAAFLAHIVDTAGGIHGLADPTAYTVNGIPADDAAAIIVINQILTALAAHVVLTAGGVHGSADAASAAALAMLTPAVTAAEARALGQDIAAVFDDHLMSAPGVHGIVDATNVMVYPTAVHGVRDAASQLALGAYSAAVTDPDAVDLANAVKDILNAHEGTVASVHGIADATNIVTSANAARATLNAGDRILFRTTAPEPQASDVVAAMTALKASMYASDFDFVHVVGSADPTFADAVSDKLDSLEGLATYTLGIMSARAPAEGFDYDEVTGPAYPGEQPSDYAFRLDLAFSVFSGERVAVGAGLKRTQNPVTLWSQRRPVAWTAVQRLLTRPVQEELGRKQAGQIDSVTSIVNSTNDYIEYNARLDDTLTARFLCLRDYEGESGVYFTLGAMMSPDGSDFSLITYVRVMNLATRLYQKVGEEQLGNGLFLETTGPRAGKIREADARKLDREIKTAIESKVGPTKGTASGITVRVSRDDNLLPVSGGPPPELTAEVAIVPLGYVGSFRGRIRFARTLTA